MLAPLLASSVSCVVTSSDFLGAAFLARRLDVGGAEGDGSSEC